MSNEWNAELAKILAQAREPLAGDRFMAKLLLKIERTRRIRMWLPIFAVVAVLGFVSLNMPWVLENTARVLRLAGDFSPTYAEVLITPWGWAASMIFGVAVLLRTRPSRR